MGRSQLYQNQQRSCPKAPPGPADVANVATKILIVDDSEVQREQLRSALEAEGFEVLEASDGDAGYDCVCNEPSLSLVISDVNMPGRHGLELLEAIREVPERLTLPVLILTAEANPSLISRARAAGSCGWLLKPLRDDILLMAVQRITEKAA